MSVAALLDLLQPALRPCRHFAGVCGGYCRWNPEQGHIPCGFGGATGDLTDVRLVLVTAEPREPADGESYAGTATEMVKAHVDFFQRVIDNSSLRRGGRTTPFHSNLCRILDRCWPGLTISEQLQRSWFTNAVLCSAHVSSGQVPRSVEEACIPTYLTREVAALPDAYVLALGDKARHRLRRCGVRVDGWAQHPSARPNTKPLECWQAAGAAFRRWLSGHQYRETVLDTN